MLYEGQAISLELIDNHVARLCFDLKGESVNKFNQLTLSELAEVAGILSANTEARGLLICSAKDSFIVGADITEFGEMAKQEEAALADAIYAIDEIFNSIEDLAIPSVTAINGLALGGGLEMALTTDFRVMTATTKIGFPEVKLGIIPGYGGTVRTPRIIGADNAVEWIATGKEYRATAALAVGLVGAVVDDSQLEAAALDLLARANAGEFDFQSRKAAKRGPLLLDDIEALMAFVTGKAMVAQQAGKHFPAPLAAAKTMEKHAKLNRDEALRVESKTVAKLAKSETARNLVGLYLNDQALMKNAKGMAAESTPVGRAAVLGAGIMGGGIAYQSAFTGTPIVMKDIQQSGLDMGLAEAGALLAKRVARKRMTPEQMAETLNKIDATLSYDDFSNVDIVVEAVVENPKVKKAVLAEVEAVVADDVILTSNTSTIPITELATALKRPENFCGMHFFNPVHRMPLVEIIRGEKSSEQAIAKTVNYALAMGKKPVVVDDCPGFLVNRILFAYFAGFVSLLKEGADFMAVDRAAEKFGWPMGPAHLCDVVGIDTAVHAGEVMAQGFPDRMSQDYKTGMEVLLENSRLGEKNSLGFYQYVADKRGRMKKQPDPAATELLAPHVAAPKEFSEEEIIQRLILPFCMEAVRCWEEGIASSAADLDMALIFGVGFPVFRGGALRYIDNLGLSTFCEQSMQYVGLGEIYRPTEKLLAMAAKGETIYPS